MNLLVSTVIAVFYINVKETELPTTPRIDNPEKLATLDTQETGRRQTCKKANNILK